MKRTRLSRQSQSTQTGIRLRSIFTSSFKAIIISCLMLILYAFLLAFSPLPENSLPYVTLIISLVLTLWAGHRVARKARSRGWLHGLLTGGCYGFLLLLIGILCVPGDFSFSFLNYLPLLLTGMVGGIVGVR